MQTAECRLAIEHLLVYMENPGMHHAEAETAIGHISTCPHCAYRVEHLIRALAMDEEDRLTCQACQGLLPDYFEAERLGQAHTERWRPVILHLEICPHCAAAYAALHDIAALAEGQRGAEPPHYPTPDLSFLRAAAVQVPWRLDELGRLVVELSAELVRALRSPSFQPALAGLKSDTSRRVICQVSLKPALGGEGEALEDLEMTITAEEKRGDPAYCTVIVQVHIPSRGGWPNLGSTRVTLKRGEQELETQQTDAFGKAVFEGILTADLEHLAFEISPAGSSC